jgi:hypothetical protein
MEAVPRGPALPGDDIGIDDLDFWAEKPTNYEATGPAGFDHRFDASGSYGIDGHPDRLHEPSAPVSQQQTRSKADLLLESPSNQWQQPARKSNTKEKTFYHLKDLPPLAGQKQHGAAAGQSENSLMAKNGSRAGAMGTSSSAPLLTAASSIMTTSTRR